MSLLPLDLGSTVLAPSIVAVQPVVDGGSVWVRGLVEEVSTHSSGGDVTSWMKHTPPHVLFTCRSWRRWSSRTPGHRRHSLAAAPFSYTFDVNGLGVDLVAEAAKAMLRLRSSYSFIPHLVFLFLLFIMPFGCVRLKLVRFFSQRSFVSILRCCVINISSPV